MGEMTAIRDAYGAALKELGEQDVRIVGLEADVASSTKSGIFGSAFPERYFNVGISELNMVSMAAGLARTGFIPFVNTFAVFLTTRGADPVQSLIAYDSLNVKLCGAYCGLSDSYDGASHQAITDMAFVRSIPNMTVIATADGTETRKAVFAIAEHQGPVYLRLSRAPAPVFYGDNMRFEIGKGIRVREGNDVSIITTGTLLHLSLIHISDSTSLSSPPTMPVCPCAGSGTHSEVRQPGRPRQPGAVYTHIWTVWRTLPRPGQEALYGFPIWPGSRALSGIHGPGACSMGPGWRQIIHPL